MTDLEGYRLYLIRKNCKPSTIKANVRTLILLEKNVNNLTKENIDAFFLKLLESGKQATYINRLIGVLRTYADFAGLEELRKYKFLRVRNNFKKSTMSDQEIEAFLALKPLREDSRTQKYWKRMTMFWKICAFTAMRMGEVAHLTIDTVDFGQGIFFLEDTKTNSPRVVPIPGNIEKELKEYIVPLENEKLFPSTYGGQQLSGGVIDGVAWRYDFQKRIQKLGIKRKNLTPYSLRHSMITRLCEEDVNITKIMKLAGHKRIETTLKYTHLVYKDIQEAIKKHPLIRKSSSPQEKVKYRAERIKSWELDKDEDLAYEYQEGNGWLRLDLKVKIK